MFFVFLLQIGETEPRNVKFCFENCKFLTGPYSWQFSQIIELFIVLLLCILLLFVTLFSKIRVIIVIYYNFTCSRERKFLI